MSFKILADTFSVARDANNFIQLKTLKSPRTEDEVWAAFRIEGDTKYARSSIQVMLDTLDETFFDNLEMSAYDRFENALKELNLSYKNLLEKRGMHALGEISAIIAIFSGNELHLSQVGDAEAYLIRKTKLSLISEGLSSKSEDLFVNIASGELMPEDKILFSTSRLLRLATPTQLTQMCAAGVVEALDNISELVLSDPELSAGVVCLSLKLSHKPSLQAQKENKENVILTTLRTGWDAMMLFIENKMESKKIGMERNKILMALGGIVVVLVLSIVFLVHSQRSSALRDEYRTQIDSMNEELRMANTKGYSNDKETANAILGKVEKEARSILETDYFRPEVLALLDKVEKTRDSINNTLRLKDLKPYADLSAKRESVEALGLLNLKENLFAFEYNGLYEIILNQVMEPKTIDQKEIVVKGTAMDDQNVLVFLTKSGRIIEYEDGNFRFMGTDDETWKQAVDFAAYGKYLYLLSPDKNQIYKYTRLRSKYSNAAEYNSTADLTGGISMAIDGSIYVLKKGGEIIKVLKGSQEDFNIQDLGADLTDATAIFTTQDQANLYVLDPKNKKVVVIQKESPTGPLYKKQIYFEELEDVQGFTVDKTEKKIYLLTKKMIYQADI